MTAQMPDAQLAEIEQRQRNAASGALYQPADFDFFNHAWRDVGALLAEVKRLREQQVCPNPLTHVEVRGLRERITAAQAVVNRRGGDS